MFDRILLLITLVIFYSVNLFSSPDIKSCSKIFNLSKSSTVPWVLTFEQKINKVEDSTLLSILNIPGISLKDKKIDEVVEQNLVSYTSLDLVEYLKQIRKNIYSKSTYEKDSIFSNIKEDINKNILIASNQIKRLQEYKVNNIESMHDIFLVFSNISSIARTISEIRLQILSNSFIIKDLDSYIKALEISIDIDPWIKHLVGTSLGKKNVFSEFDFKIILSFFLPNISNTSFGQNEMNHYHRISTQFRNDKNLEAFNIGMNYVQNAIKKNDFQLFAKNILYLKINYLDYNSNQLGDLIDSLLRVGFEKVDKDELNQVLWIEK